MILFMLFIFRFKEKTSSHLFLPERPLKSYRLLLRPQFESSTVPLICFERTIGMRCIQGHILVFLRSNILFSFSVQNDLPKLQIFVAHGGDSESVSNSSIRLTSLFKIGQLIQLQPSTKRLPLFLYVRPWSKANQHFYMASVGHRFPAPAYIYTIYMQVSALYSIWIRLLIGGSSHTMWPQWLTHK